MKRMEEKPMTNHQSDRMETLARIDELERLKEMTDDERVIEKIKARLACKQPELPCEEEGSGTRPALSSSNLSDGGTKIKEEFEK